MDVGDRETAMVMFGAVGGGTGEWKDVKLYVNSKTQKQLSLYRES